MYAVLKTGGKQYRVAPNDVIKIEKTSGDVGEIVTFDDVLMVGGDTPEIGTPMVSGASVAGVVLEQGRADKIIVFKKKRRQNYRRTRGHRQHQTVIRITEILTGGAKPTKTAADVKPKAAAAPKKAPAAAEASAEPKPLFDAPSGPADDLTKISGVGPVLVEKLNKLGITQFQQVADLTPEQIEQVDAALDFKGRIEREEWIPQAKKLAAGED